MNAHEGKSKWNKCWWLICAVILLTGCGGQKSSNQQEMSDTGFISADPGIYDSTDTAVLTAIDLTEKTITLKNMDLNKRYTLTYDGTTCFFDKYGNALSPSQMKVGEVVDLTFLKLRKRLNTLQRSKNSWVYQDITGFKMDSLNYQIGIKEDVFTYSEETVVISGAEEIDLLDIHETDMLSFYGKGKDVYSIVVERGHGYVRLKNEEYFIGGWIEIGDRVVSKISENMLLVVPEGEHKAIISNKGTSGTKDVPVRRNVETELDVGGLKGTEPKYGNVIFSIVPSDALLYIDGEKTDYSVPVRLEYGIHQMIVMADQYNTITQYIKVGQSSAGIDVTLEADPDVSGNNPTDEEIKDVDLGNTTVTSTSTTSYYVSIDAPQGVEVYLDGNYIGISPCNFKKQSGSHTITLRKTGYITKSYTVQIDDEEKNTNYAFLDLIKEE